MSQHPAIVAAQARLIFPKIQSHRTLEAFFLALSISLFDSISLDRALIGHIKLYGEGSSKSVIRANVTGRRESVQVEIRNFQPEKQVKVWLNVIAYGRSEGELRESLHRTLIQLTAGHKVKLQALRVAHEHDQN